MGWSVNYVMPGSDGLRISKRRQLSLDCGPVELVVYWGPVQWVVDLDHVDG